MEPTPPTPDDLDAKREKERLRKAAFRERRARQDAERETGKKRALPAPRALTNKLGEVARLTDPISPGQARRQLHAATTAVKHIIRSDAEFEEEEFETAGAAFADLSKAFWPLRLFITLLGPLILIGSLTFIGRKLVTSTPWWRRWQEQKQEKARAQEGSQLRVVEAPAGESDSGFAQPPRPGITRPRRPAV